MRISSIDSLRVFAVGSVISIHTKPFMADLFREPAYRLPEYLFNQPTRVAVPFFFVVTGFFLAKSTAELRGRNRWLRVWSYSQRPLLLLVAWSILYALIPSDWPSLRQIGYQELASSRLRHLVDSPLTLLFEGGKVHLWFLPSLVFGVVLLTLCTQGGRTLPAIALSALLFLLGLAGGSYAVTPLGLHLPFSTRDGPFLSMACLVAGYLLHAQSPPISTRLALWLIGLGLLLQVGESWVLWRYFAVPWLQHDYLLGTVIAAMGVFLLALANPDLGRNFHLPALGQYTLGVYLCHYLFVDALGPLIYLCEPHLWQLLFPLLVFWLSLGLTALLSRSRLAKVLVT